MCDSFWRLYVNDRHGATITVNRTRHKLQKHQVYLIPAHTWFAGESNRQLGHFFIHFDWVGLSSPTINACFPGAWKVHDTEVARQIVDTHITEFISQSRTHLQWSMIAHSIVCMALSDVLGQLSPKVISRLEGQSTSDALIGSLIELAVTQLNDPLTTEQLAAQAGLTPTHLIRRFRAATGQTPGQYLLDQRIRLAASLLLQSDETVDAIAEQTGFADRFHFSKMFKSRMGVSPVRYRTGELDRHT